MCRVMRGRVDRADRTAAMPSGSSCTRYGRPDRSTAACTSASSSGTSASPNRRMPALSPSAWRERLRRARSRCPRPCGARRCRRSPSVAHGQVEAAVPGELVQHVVVEADAGGDRRPRRCRRGRSRPSTLVSLVLPLDPAGAAHGSPLRRSAIATSARAGTRRSPRACRRSPAASRAGRRRGPARRGRAAPARPRAGRRTGRTARSWRRCRRPCSPRARSAADDPVPLRLERVDRGRAARRACASAARAAAWVSADRW